MLYNKLVLEFQADPKSYEAYQISKKGRNGTLLATFL